MEPKKLLKQITKLFDDQQIRIAIKILRSIRIEEKRDRIKSAVKRLYKDYQHDTELIAFLALDPETFYETK